MKAWVSWSTGKDSAFALQETRRQGQVEVAGLLTTVTREFGRVSMHGVREGLLDHQANALGLPVLKVFIPSPCTNVIYEKEMSQALQQAREQRVTHVVFGDLFLEDLRAYREARLAEIGMSAVFPLWGRNTRTLPRD
jgi:diphthamide synthase (EF-2-diphthine--ammonia ligase)